MNIYINKPFLYRDDLYKQYFDKLKENFLQRNMHLVVNKVVEPIDIQNETIVIPKNYNTGISELKNIYIEDNFYKYLDKIFLLSDIIVIIPSGEADNCEIYTMVQKSKDIPIYIVNINHYFDNLLSYFKKKSILGYKVVNNIEELIEKIDELLISQKVKKL